MMIWLIGNKGMLGTDVEDILNRSKKDFIASDMEVDITNLENLKGFSENRKIDWIINCAAYTEVDKAEKEQEEAFRVNAFGALNVAKIASEAGAKLIHISTDYIFDGEKEDAYTEEDTPNPLNVYGKSKLEGERYVRYNLDMHYVIRTSWLYGLHGKNFVTTMFGLFNKKSEVMVVSDQWGSPTYTKDLAWVILHLIASRGSSYGVYHFSGEGKTSWYRFANELYESAREFGIVNRRVKILPVFTNRYPSSARRPKNSYLSKKKIKATFNIKVPEWQESLKEFLSDFRKK